MTPPEVTVIMPTCGVSERARSLRDAVESVLAQQRVRAVPLVVLNGTRSCAEVQQWLDRERRIRLVRLAEAGLPTALQTGRALVDTPFFATLDDDDLLLPNAMAVRLQALQSDDALDVVVTNGFIRNGTGDELNIRDGAVITADPLRALLVRNWLLPGSWLGRTARVSPALFENIPRFLECTYFALRFASEYRMRWLETPTVIYNQGSPEALSSSRGYVLGQAEALRHILSLRLAADVRDVLHRRIADAFHSAADHDLRAGIVGEAWRWHLASLRERGGLRYLPFTWRLIQGSWRWRG